ncbi:Uncharacterised protein [Porphyromonas macacae]|uniref:Uncharacterized protein n=1 Tax=Porphyromonas macacae TaxID=28115 RepID=A0A379EBE6_9PORP|nr:Uncharacterised protein [Porphyromonas macacae]
MCCGNLFPPDLIANRAEQSAHITGRRKQLVKQRCNRGLAVRAGYSHQFDRIGGIAVPCRSYLPQSFMRICKLHISHTFRKVFGKFLQRHDGSPRCDCLIDVPMSIYGNTRNSHKKAARLYLAGVCGHMVHANMLIADYMERFKTYC